MPRRPATPPELLRAIAEEDWRSAFAHATRFRHLGDGKTAIQQAWAAWQHPAFYRELGHNPDALIAAGIVALRARFSPSDSDTPVIQPT